MTTKAQVDAIVAYIDNTGGLVPGEINGFTGDLGALAGSLPPGPVQDEVKRIQIGINVSNLKIGDRLGEKKGLLNTLRGMVLALPVDAEAPPVTPPPGPIVVVPEGGFVGTVYKSGLGPAENPSGMIKWNAGVGSIYEVKAGSDGLAFSVTAGSGGVPMEVSRKADMSDVLPQTGSTPELPAKVGDSFFVRFTGGATVQLLTASMPR